MEKKLYTTDELKKEWSKSAEFKEAYEDEVELLDIAIQLYRAFKQKKISVKELARRMNTSPAQVRRLLDPTLAETHKLGSILKFARALGMRLRLSLENKEQQEVRKNANLAEEILRKLSSSTSAGYFRISPRKNRKAVQDSSLTPRLKKPFVIDSSWTEQTTEWQEATTKTTRQSKMHGWDHIKFKGHANAA